MDVKELVKSHLFYPQIFTKHSYFSAEKEQILLPYNQELDSMLMEDPNNMFAEEKQKEMSKRKKFDIMQLVKDEQYEMQYNYIFMEKIEGNDKLEVSRTLKDC